MARGASSTFCGGRHRRFSTAISRQGTKDFDASRVVLEPLADFDKDGNLVPILAAEIPSLDNGGVSKDGMSVTWKLKQGVKWSDGEDFTADDVKFTYRLRLQPATPRQPRPATMHGGRSVDAVDPKTVKINFKNPTPGWYGVFCGAYGYILPQHVLKDPSVPRHATRRSTSSRSAPVHIRSMSSSRATTSTYSINDNFREADKPFFKTVYLKGGGDATSAARAAIQTGEVDYSWNLQVEWGVLQSLKDDSGPGDW